MLLLQGMWMQMLLLKILMLFMQGIHALMACAAAIIAHAAYANAVPVCAGAI